jgi:hypothetical protein
MREIRSYGSVRGVRSNPYPYRDTPPPDAVGGALLTFPRYRTVTRESDTRQTVPARLTPLSLIASRVAAHPPSRTIETKLGPLDHCYSTGRGDAVQES